MAPVFMDSIVLDKFQAATSVSADYDKIAGLFEEFQVYLLRLKILEGSVPPVPELKVALTEVLVSVLTLCAISAKYIKKKRIGKWTFATLLSCGVSFDDYPATILHAYDLYSVLHV